LGLQAGYMRLPRGIGPASWLYERLSTARKFSLVNCSGMSPLSLFDDRSKF
jgi:hypothetical protein